jgi:hypothetical protein
MMKNGGLMRTSRDFLMLNNVKVNFAVRTPYYQLCLNVFYDIDRLYKRVFAI